MRALAAHGGILAEQRDPKGIWWVRQPIPSEGFSQIIACFFSAHELTQKAFIDCILDVSQKVSSRCQARRQWWLLCWGTDSVLSPLCSGHTQPSQRCWHLRSPHGQSWAALGSFSERHPWLLSRNHTASHLGKWYLPSWSVWKWQFIIPGVLSVPSVGAEQWIMLSGKVTRCSWVQWEPSHHT